VVVRDRLLDAVRRDRLGLRRGGLLLAKLIDPVGPHELLLLAGTIVTLCATVAATVPARRPRA
jgi:hypothetical protein